MPNELKSESITDEVFKKLIEKIAEEAIEKSLEKAVKSGSSTAVVSKPCTSTEKKTISIEGDAWEWEVEWTDEDKKEATKNLRETAQSEADEALDKEIVKLKIDWRCKGECVPFLELSKREYKFSEPIFTGSWSNWGKTMTITCTVSITVTSGCKMPISP